MIKKIFYSVIIIKIILISAFSSEFSNDLFLPFLQTFVEGNLNPWDFYVRNNLNIDAFPYHPLMLYLLSPFALIISILNIKNFLILNFLFKLPLLLFDIFLYKFLEKNFPVSKKKLLVYYFLNPIIFYGLYIYGQLDIIPTAILIVSLVFLKNNKIIYSAIFLGLSISTKIHVVVILPLILFFILKKIGLRSSILYLMTTISIIIIIDLPFIFSDGFQKMVLFNTKQSVILKSSFNLGSVNISIPILFISIFYFYLLTLKKINFDLVFSFIAILFSSLIFLIYPSPAWYIWLVPFISIFFSKKSLPFKQEIIYFSFCFLYIIFFTLFYEDKYDSIYFLNREIFIIKDSKFLTSLFFTLLESVLFLLMFLLYSYGVKSNSFYNKQNNLVIAVAGDSASGKTTFLKNFSMILKNKMLHLEGDGDHRWERNDLNWKKTTHLNPKANYIHRQAGLLKKLKNHVSIERRDYNHQDGKFSDLIKINPKDYILISGLHPFYLPIQRKICDIKIYLDTDEELRKYWKINRDVKKRGYTKDEVSKQIKSRIKDGKLYIHPQLKYADIVVKYYPLKKLTNKNLDVKLGLKISIPADINIDQIIDEFEGVVWNYNSDLLTQSITFNQKPELDFLKIVKKYIINHDEIISHNAEFSSGFSGLIQLFLIILISENLKSYEI